MKQAGEGHGRTGRNKIGEGTDDQKAARRQLSGQASAHAGC